MLSLFLFFSKDLIGFVEVFLPLHQKPETGFFDATLILIQNKTDLMSWHLEIISINANLKQEQTVKELGFSDDIELIWKCFVTMETATRSHRPTMTSKGSLGPTNHDSQSTTKSIIGGTNVIDEASLDNFFSEWVFLNYGTTNATFLKRNSEK